MVVTSYPRNGIQDPVTSHSVGPIGTGRSGILSRTQLYTCVRPPTFVRQVMFNPVLTPYQCGICLTFYTSQADNLERHIGETHRLIEDSSNRQVASHPSAQSAQSQALFVPNVSQLQQELNGSRYVTYQNPWMATLRSTAVRARTGFASHPTYTYNIHGSQPSPGTVFTQSQVSPTLPQPTNRLHHRTMAVAAPMPAIITTGNCFLTGVAQVFGGRGTTRGTDGTNPGVKRRRSYPDLKPPFERNSGRMLDPSETTESTARIASAGTLQQDNEMVMFEQPDPRPGQLIAAATVPSTCRDSEFSHSQDTGAELTGLTTASVAAKGTSLGTITQHSPANLTNSTGGNRTDATIEHQNKSKQASDTFGGEKIYPEGPEEHHLPRERLSEPRADTSCLSVVGQDSIADQTMDPKDQHVLSLKGKVSKMITDAVASTYASMIAFCADEDRLRLTQYSTLEAHRLGLENGPTSNVPDSETALFIPDENSGTSPSLAQTDGAPFEAPSEPFQASNQGSRKLLHEVDENSKGLLQEDEEISTPQRGKIDASRNGSLVLTTAQNDQVDDELENHVNKE